MSPQILEYKVILCFERRHLKQNSVIRLKSIILVPQIFCPLKKFWTDYTTGTHYSLFYIVWTN